MGSVRLDKKLQKVAAAALIIQHWADDVMISDDERSCTRISLLLANSTTQPTHTQDRQKHEEDRGVAVPGRRCPRYVHWGWHWA